MARRPGLRVIGGEARGRKLKLAPGDSTRPIGNRVREALFNILGAEIEGARFLDLFGGTGAVGIEALSRGAALAVFVEMERRAVDTIRENLRATGFESNARVVPGDAFRFLAQPVADGFDIVFIAPPQYQELWSRALQRIDQRLEWLTAHGRAIVQIDPVEHTELALQSLVCTDARRYGNTELRFYTRSQPEALNDHD